MPKQPTLLIKPADAAIVLGAKTHRNSPTRAFQERIDFGIALYRAQKVRKIIFTGGLFHTSQKTEAEIAFEIALQQNIPHHDLILEKQSTNTFENLAYSKTIAENLKLHHFLIVTQAFHMKRALKMGMDLHLDVLAAPVPESDQKSLWDEWIRLGREALAYWWYLLKKWAGKQGITAPDSDKWPDL